MYVDLYYPNIPNILQISSMAEGHGVIVDLCRFIFT